MKALILLSLISFGSLYAQEAKTQDISARKAKAIARIDERISVMQSKKACINSAADKTALKSCHKDHKDQMKGMRDGYKAKRAERKAKRKKN